LAFVHSLSALNSLSKRSRIRSETKPRILVAFDRRTGGGCIFFERDERSLATNPASQAFREEMFPAQF
jgi:hypothetical protein